eukprot:427252-Rhodomonas_salina.1
MDGVAELVLRAEDFRVWVGGWCPAGVGAKYLAWLAAHTRALSHPCPAMQPGACLCADGGNASA